MTTMWKDKKKIKFMKDHKLGLYGLYKDDDKRKKINKYMEEHEIGWWVTCAGINMKNVIAERLLGMEEAREEKDKAGEIIGDLLLNGRIHSVIYCFIHPFKEPILLTSQLDSKATKYFEKVGKVIVAGPRVDIKTKILELLKEAQEWGGKRVALEYSPRGRFPFSSLVDGGTCDLFKHLVKKYIGTNKLRIVSSANISQMVTAVLNRKQVESHKVAAQHLAEIQKDAFEEIRKRIRNDEIVTEHNIAKFIRSRYKHYNMETFDPPPWDALVAANPGNKHPHYGPDVKTPENEIKLGKNHQIKKGSLVFIDVTAREKGDTENVFADITWVGYVGTRDEIPKKVEEVFDVVAKARDSAVKIIEDRCRDGETVTAYEIDLAARNVLDNGPIPKFKEFGHCIHEIGHGIDTEGHGSGAGAAAYKYKDDRDAIPGILFSIEPGYYFDKDEDVGKKAEDPFGFGSFGVRSEIDVFIGMKEGSPWPFVTTCKQKRIIPILDDKWGESFDTPTNY